ncbi:CDP-alcohol phosphatidyltransferase family protein [Demequina sp.]|uniref:CDP-alcohol phosphatidyltransferase family protein n=1 Tax=Demequina sp. TaxID=2050685 RepID=UPI003D0CCE55
MSREWPTIEQMRDVCQPPEIRGRKSAEHWTATLFGRSFSIYLTRIAVWLGLSANAVTGIMILCGWAAAAALLIPGVWGPLLACFLAFLQMTIDSIDGEVARWRRTTGPRGIFLDRIAHTTTESAIPFAAGLAVTLAATPHDWRWATVGGATATLVLVNKSLRDAMRLSRVQAGLDLPRDAAGARVISSSLIGKARRAADFVPLHRLYHSVEQTIVLLVAAILGALFDFNGLAVGLAVLACALPFVIVGHVTAILASSTLRGPTP